MQVTVPFHMEYETPGSVPIGDVIESLTALKLLIEEGGFNLGHIVPNLSVEKVQVNVRSISQQSPLRELLLVTLFLAFQKQLEAEVPPAIESLLNVQVSKEYDTIVTVSVLMLIFYGVGYAKDLISNVTTRTQTQKMLDRLIGEFSKETGVAEEDVRKRLKARYKPRGRMKLLAASAVKFFKPSKDQGNVPITVGRRKIEPRLIREVPTDFAFNDASKLERSRNHSSIALDLHAQDKDKELAGWAAVPVGISGKRLRMKLVDGVTPDQLWNRDSIIGDIVMKYRRVGMEFEPYEIHLSRVLD